jgi:hypothetical protein
MTPQMIRSPGTASMCSLPELLTGKDMYNKMTSEFEKNIKKQHVSFKTNLRKMLRNTLKMKRRMNQLKSD